MRRCTICLFIYLFVCNLINAQTISHGNTFQKPGGTIISGSQILPYTARISDTCSTAAYYPTSFTFMASNYYTNTLGFFCKKEIQMEKALKLPIKFRLGSVAYTDKMEGKGTGVLPISGKR